MKQLLFSFQDFEDFSNENRPFPYYLSQQFGNPEGIDLRALLVFGLLYCSSKKRIRQYQDFYDIVTDSDFQDCIRADDAHLKTTYILLHRIPTHYAELQSASPFNDRCFGNEEALQEILETTFQIFKKDIFKGSDSLTGTVFV